MAEKKSESMRVKREEATWGKLAMYLAVLLVFWAVILGLYFRSQ